jgi:flagellar biosynthetic protein FlhB
MALDSDQGERTEEPTTQRREDFRKRGQVAQTRELASVFVMFSAAAMIWLLGRFLFEQVNSLFQLSYGEGLVAAGRGSGNWIAAGRFAFEKMSFMLAPVFGISFLVSFASTALQTGFIYNEEALQFRPDRLDPISGFGRIFSLKALIEGFKAFVKLCVILFLSYWLLKDQIMVLPNLIHFDVGQIFSFLAEMMTRLLAGIGLFMMFLASADYLFQRWELEKEMRMTKQEVREEMKSREGDPLVKARIKRVQREIASRRMMDDVPKADVIVTNPTHIAIALKYDESMVSPRVVAKGADLLAEKIKAIAKEHKVPIVENKPLARAIFKTIKIGQSIPRELYTAVAEVLSYVYRLKKRRR